MTLLLIMQVICIAAAIFMVLMGAVPTAKPMPLIAAIFFMAMALVVEVAKICYL